MVSAFATSRAVRKRARDSDFVRALQRGHLERDAADHNEIIVALDANYFWVRNRWMRFTVQSEYFGS